MIKRLRDNFRPLANLAHAALINMSARKSEHEAALQLARIPSSNAHPPLVRRPLFDGHFHNPGYWYRLQLLRAALGTSEANELAFLWKYNQNQCRTTLKKLGVAEVRSLYDKGGVSVRNDARRLASRIRSAEDVLELRLPHDIPASFLYDAILKRQRRATVDGTDPRIEHDIHELLIAIAASEAMIDAHDPDLIAMSHVINSQCIPMAWIGAKNGIPVITLFGNYGVPRFWRMNHPGQVFQSVDCPAGSDLDELPTAKANALIDMGRKYLALRTSGKSNDIGGRMAFSGGSGSNRLHASRDGRPLVAVYASNWFDYPHSSGMGRFRDFLDWIDSTLRVALETPSVRWLFRAHPCDKWYGGMTLADIMPTQLPDHVALSPDDCTGSDVMHAADAVVTYHGTAAIEYAAQGKPVLIADRGWYHDCGFALLPDSREHYLELLASDWFTGRDIQSAKRRAEIFSGWYFCVPEWQTSLVMPDDSDRISLRKQLVRMIGEEELSIRREVALIREWFLKDEHGYHTFKMKTAETYAVSNVSS